MASGVHGAPVTAPAAHGALESLEPMATEAALRRERQRLGAWVLFSATTAASVVFVKQMLGAWQESEVLAAQSWDPGRSYREQSNLHERAVLRWEDGNQSRNWALATGVAGLSAGALLMRLYSDDSTSRLELSSDGPRLSIGWKF